MAGVRGLYEEVGAMSRLKAREVRAAWTKTEHADDGDGKWFSAHQSQDFHIRYRDAAEYADIEYVLIRKLALSPADGGGLAYCLGYFGIAGGIMPRDEEQLLAAVYDVLLSRHPKLAARWRDVVPQPNDRDWFAQNPQRRYRLRPACAIDSIDGSLALCEHVIIYDVEPGQGVRVRAGVMGAPPPDNDAALAIRFGADDRLWFSCPSRAAVSHTSTQSARGVVGL
jgi:hypothetical protein